MRKLTDEERADRKEKQREYYKRYREEHLEEIREKQKEYREAHKAERHEYNIKYYWSHRDSEQARHAENYRKRREEAHNRNVKWAREHDPNYYEKAIPQIVKEVDRTTAHKKAYYEYERFEQESASDIARRYYERYSDLSR